MPPVDRSVKIVVQRVRLGAEEYRVISPAAGSGLAGLAQRARTVDGRLKIASPPGGPTTVTAVLPLRA